LSNILIDAIIVAPSQLEIPLYDRSLVVNTFIFEPYPLKSFYINSRCNLYGVDEKLAPPPII